MDRGYAQRYQPPPNSNGPIQDNRLAVSQNLRPEDTVGIFQDALETARQGLSLSENEKYGGAMKDRLLINLQYRGLRDLPPGVIDLIREDVDRLKLSHNQIYQVPPQIDQCIHLRYLNIRNNDLTEFPNVSAIALDVLRNDTESRRSFIFQYLKF